MILGDPYRRFQGHDILQRQITRSWQVYIRTMAEVVGLYDRSRSVIFNYLE